MVMNSMHKQSYAYIFFHIITTAYYCTMRKNRHIIYIILNEMWYFY